MLQELEGQAVHTRICPSDDATYVNLENPWVLQASQKSTSHS